MYARKVAAHIDTVHHEIVFTVQDGLDALPDVIRHLETFDVTTIRAGTPMYLMARKIKAMGIKMVLSGEGADEVFGGYLYFHMAPSAEEFHEETVRKLFALSRYDCCRANKATAAWGVEARVPFLDKEFLDYAMSIDPAEKMCPGAKIEKAYCGKLLPTCCRRRSCGVKRNSFQTEWGTAGLSACGITPRAKSRIRCSQRRGGGFRCKRRPRRKDTSIGPYSTAFSRIRQPA